MAEQATMAGERGGRREQNKAENRAALLKAARAVFAEIGYGAAGVRDIVRRTDLASGTFYNYFKDKAEIFEAVVGEMTAELLKRQRGGGRATARTAEEFFRRHCTVYFHFVAEDPEIVAFGRNNVTAIRMMLERPDLQVLAQALLDDVRSAMERGILPRVDVGYFMASLTGIVFEASVAMVSRDPVDPDEATEFVTRMMLGGLEKVAGRP
jgi:AcrR family transcriptional regulator